MYTANYSHHARNVELQGFDWIPKNSCWVGFPINPLQLCSVLLDLSSYHWWRKSYSWYWQSRLPVFTNTNRLFVHPMNTSICSKKRGFRAWWIRLYWSIYLKKVIILLFTKHLSITSPHDIGICCRPSSLARDSKELPPCEVPWSTWDPNLHEMIWKWLKIVASKFAYWNLIFRLSKVIPNPIA